MKEVKIKFFPVLFLFLFIPILTFFNKEKITYALTENKNLEGVVNKIIKENNDKELIANENFNQKFIYLAFKKDDFLKTFLIDTKTYQNTDIINYVKEEKKDEYLNKINYLLYLKYPKFIADILNSENTIKNFELKSDEMIIHYQNEELDNNLLLHVNYNEIDTFLEFPTSKSSEYINEDGYNYDKSKKAVALTFDDGPNGSRTRELLRILEENKAHATFFMVGNKMEAGRDTIINVLSKNNEIGSHSYNHKNMKRMKLEDVIKGEEETQRIYHEITNDYLIYTRPPYGNITDKIKENLDTIFINWNLDTEDWRYRNKEHIVNYVMENVCDGGIILMHDSYDSTVEAVEELLPKLYLEGYQVMSISELANLKGITLENHEIYNNLKEIE